MTQTLSTRPRALVALTLLPTLGVMGAAATPTEAAPLRDSFERPAAVSGSAWSGRIGRPRIDTRRAVSGTRSLQTPRSRGAHFLERRLTRPARRTSIAFSFRRARPGISGLVEFTDNRLRLTDDGRGRLRVMHQGKRIAAARVAPAQRWNRVKIQIDARRDRVRLFVGGSSRGRWIRVPGLRPERRIRLGTPNARRGPVWFDAVNRPLPRSPQQAPTVAPVEAPATAPAPIDVPPVKAPDGRTTIGFSGDDWTINGVPVNAGSASEGTLQSARLVQGVWDDANPASRSLWSRGGTPWDPERNVAGLIAAMPGYAAHGLNAITLSLQGGSPTRPGLPSGSWEGTNQTPVASAFSADGSLDPLWQSRTDRVIAEADRLGMTVILTAFYFGQAHRLEDDAAVRRATYSVADWLREAGYTNVVLEIGNELGAWDYGGHRILNTERGLPGLIRDTKARHPSLLVTISHSNTRGRTRTISPELLSVLDVLLIHGNTESDSELAGDIAWLRGRFAGPIHVNEDSASAIDRDRFDLLTRLGVGNGYYDQTGFQSPPTVWELDTSGKREYFERVRAATGG